MNFRVLKTLSPLFVAVLVFLGLAPVPQAQIVVEEEPAEVHSEVTSIDPERPFWLALRIYPKAGNFVPYVDQETGDKGVIVDFALPEGFEKGETLRSKPKVVTGTDLYGYQHPFWVLQEIVPTHNAKFQEKYVFPGQISWVECNSADCLDYEQEASIELPYGPGLASIKNRELFETARASLPAPIPWPVRYSAGGGNFKLTIYTDYQETRLDEGIILLSQGKTAGDINAALEVSLEDGNIVYEGRPAGYLPRSTLQGLLIIPGVQDQAYILDVENDFQTERALSLSSPGLSGLTIWLALGLAFLGGLILNLMPCVFPVLTLKVFGLVKAGTSSRRALKIDGLAYTAGILMTFAFVALLFLTFRELGNQVGWGFQLQSPYFVTVLGLVLFLVTLNFAGVFDLKMPLAFTGKSESGGAMGSFYTGMLATVVATPCTAPFMAPALGFALTLETGEALLVFLGLGLGMAFPYLMVSFIPKFQKLFPKPGPWMMTFRKILALPLFLTVVWLAWVLKTQVGVKGVVVFSTYALLTAVLVYGWKKRQKAGPASQALLATLLVAVAGGIVYVTLPVFDERLESFYPEGADTVVWSEGEVWNLRLQGKGVFVNYTASWCLTCKVNEKLVFEKEKFRRYLAENEIVYMEADWTNYDPQIAVSLETLGRTALPVYVFYPNGGPTKEPVLLPEVLTLEKALEIIDANKP